MIALPTILYALSAGAVGAAAARARREPRHRPLAALLVLGLAADLVVALLEPDGGWPHPLRGTARAAFHLAESLHAAYPLAVLGAAAAALVPGRRGLLTGIRGWAAAYLVVLVVAYPTGLWGGPLVRVYTGTQVLVVLGLGGVVGSWLRGRRWHPVPKTAPELLLLWAAAVETMNLAGPYFLGFARWFPLATGAYAIFYVVVIVIELGGGRWRRGS